MIIADAIDVCVCLTCEYCDWRAMHSGPMGEVAEFLRARAIEHTRENHPAKLPAGNADLVVLRDLGIRYGFQVVT